MVPGFAEAHNVALQVLAQLPQQERPIHPAVQDLHSTRAVLQHRERGVII